ncbi:MAG: aspartate ammonia-lyase [Woeseiaceae bacterium]
MSKAASGMEAESRIEDDGLGPVTVAGDDCYGVHTIRALENFTFTVRTIGSLRHFVESFALVKKAAALANYDTGLLSAATCEAICLACDEIAAGRHGRAFPIDVLQGGAGTSTNMNVNEVIANLALKSLGYPYGAYDRLHPIDDVNRSQSTNDVYPTAARITVIRNLRDLRSRLVELTETFLCKAVEFDEIVKVGRTQLQDAVPMLLGDEFRAFAVMLGEDAERLREAENLLAEVNLGGTAIGTGINASNQYRAKVINHLSEISCISIRPSASMVEATSDPGAMLLCSSMLRRVAVKLSKVANDLRLLCSGPRTGLGEIRLPKVQAGSSIMPGKVNPVIPEAVNQACFTVMVNDLTIMLACDAGQLQLNAMQPVIVWKILESIELLERAAVALRDRCVTGIVANAERCRELLLRSSALATALTPLIGYDAAAEIVKQAETSGESILDVLRARGVMDDSTIGKLLSP